MSHDKTNLTTQNTSVPAGTEQANTDHDNVLSKSEARHHLSHLLIQPKLTVGSPDDPYEKEADAVADRVMRMPEPGFVQRKCAECEEEEKELQRKPLRPVVTPFFQAKNETTISDGMANSIQSSKGGGSMLDPGINSFMSSRFNHDFSAVRIHTDSRATQLSRDLNAKAFTAGNDVYFNAGQYRPGSSEGKHLLAHELTHVMQQNSGYAKTIGTSPSEFLMKRDGGESPQQGLNEETVACPDPERLDEIEENFRSMIESARARGANVAADNLEYFLSGAGGTRTLSVSWLRGFSAVISAETRNQRRFESSLESIADRMNPGDSRTFDDYWDAQLTASVTSELYYASGTSTIRSTGDFSLERTGDVVNIRGTVEHRWYDPYDWHGGLGAYIPGHGNVSDNDGLLMQSCRGASPFQMEAVWSQELTGSVTVKDYWFNSSSFTWTGP